MTDDGVMADEDLARGEGCYKLLLDAGTDASMAYKLGSGTYECWTSAFKEFLLLSRPVSHSCRNLLFAKQLIEFRPK